MLDKVTKQKLVVIGNGMAGIRTVELLLDRAPDLYEITVFGSEPYGNYNRILLSPVLAGEKSVDDIMLNTEQWYEDNGITLRKGETIAMIDRRTCEVVTEAGDRVPYDRLLIATGSNPIMLPLPGKDLPGVIGFRDIYDVNRMVEASESRTNAVVIGGGLLGLEAANGLMKRGMNVTVVHLLDALMERQLDPVASGMLRKSLEERGMVFKMPAQTQAILGEDHVTGVRFADGSELRPIWLSWRSASGQTSNWPGRPASIASAASSSPTPCRPMTGASMRSENACSTAARPTASSRRCSTRPGFAPINSR